MVDKNLFNDLASDFGMTLEDLGNMQDVESEVINRLNKSEKLDEIDTIAFGIETDDEKIIKVYIKADQADDFEKALSKKLGEIDDIEQLLNDLDKDFEIIDVEWPREDTVDNISVDNSNGSSALNQAVYNNKNEKAETNEPSFEESLDLDDEIITESSSLGPIEDRLTTPIQLMIYHAIIELGIPVNALDKSAYRSSIIKGIKSKADELMKQPSMKNALKLFIKKSIDFDKTSKSNSKKIIKEDISDDFWNYFISLLTYISVKPDDVEQIRSNYLFKKMKNESDSALSTRFTPQIKQKLENLIHAIPTNEEIEITEGTTQLELLDLFSKLLKIASNDETTINAFLNSSQFKQMLNHSNTSFSVKFNGALRAQLNYLLTALSIQAESINIIENIKSDWNFNKNDDYITLETDGFIANLDEESQEKLLKSIYNKQVIIIKDFEKNNKIVFSPRGTNILVKYVGNSNSFTLTNKDVDNLLEIINKDMKD